ncbi:MAG: cation:proton antiporter [Candidatus Diapherotrites archaeon]|nr:cation:proton antiporter [Candidatus Diapherotrites archaeon]
MIEFFLIAATALGLCALVALLRLALGPTLPDRVVAVDTINTLVVSSMVALGVYFQHFIYVDVAIVYALLSFVSTLLFAKYLEAGA